MLKIINQTEHFSVIVKLPENLTRQLQVIVVHYIKTLQCKNILSKMLFSY